MEYVNADAVTLHVLRNLRNIIASNCGHSSVLLFDITRRTLFRSDVLDELL